MDENRKRMFILVMAAGLFVGGIILWFLLRMNGQSYSVSEYERNPGDGWDIYYNDWENGNPDGYTGGDGYGNGNGSGYTGGDGYGNGNGSGYTGGDGYGNGNGSGYTGGDGYGYGNGSGYTGGDGYGYGSGSGYTGGNGDGDVGGTDYGDNSGDYSGDNGIFGDNRWEIYVDGLFNRISPDYAVDSLEVLNEEGVQLFIRAAELCGSTGNETYAALTNDIERQRWNSIAEDVHTARYLWQLDEIILSYTLNTSKWRESTEYNDYQAYLAENITDSKKRQEALMSGSFYHIITDLQGRMSSKALGYTWSEAMDRVLLTAGDDLAEVVVHQEDYIPDEQKP